MNKDNFDELKIKVEGILFSYGDWISPRDIMSCLKLDSEAIVKNILKELQIKYKEDYSFHIEEKEDGNWRMALKEEYADLVSELISGVEIPQGALKVLSVIAYEQPVTKTRLSEILGRSVKEDVNYLYRNKFLSYEKVGIGKYYRVTKKFYDYFKIDEDSEDFRSKANKSIKTYFQDPTIENTEDLEEKKETQI